MRRWLGRPEPQVRGGGSGTVGVSGSGFARQSYNPPPATAPFEEWMGYLREHAALTDKALDDLGNRLGGAERTMRQSIDRESETRSGEIARVESMVRDSVAGPDRAGLDRAWYGLTATAIGIAMAGVATLWP